MICLFTDFGAEGPYVGQMEVALRRDAPSAPVVRLMSDAPPFAPQAAAYLLASLVPELPSGTVLLGVVDPGVGSDRPACVVQADGRWFVGPGNGLFEMVARRALTPPRCWEIAWRPERLSASFHGRDLFAPVAARVWNGDLAGLEAREQSFCRQPEWPDDLAEVIYIDAFGNAMTGIRATSFEAGTVLRVGGAEVARARTFGDVPKGAALCYANSGGLVEIAVNGGRADTMLGLGIGTPVAVDRS